MRRIVLIFSIVMAGLAACHAGCRGCGHGASGTIGPGCGCGCG